MYGPILRGEQVTLRPPTNEDAAFRSRYLADLQLSRFARMPWHGADSSQQVEEAFARVAESKEALWWAIEVDGRGIGGTIITKIDWGARHGYHGYYIGDRAYWGRGVATEASRLVTRFAFLSLGLNKLKAEVVAEHVPSQRVLEKVGFRTCGLFRQEYYVDGRAADIVWYELLRRDWDGPS